ncbi:MAG: serine/threonine-protein kinase [Gemmataceae bacterium]
MSELELFTEALSRADDGERAAYLETTCGTAGPLRERIDQLLALHAEQASLLDLEPAALLGELAGGHGGADRSAAVAGRPAVQPGLAVGPYLLVEKIGEGGMGEVWVARQTAPVRRKVALKLLKPGLDSRAVLARFEQERQALALMDHPNIARVLDAGMGPTGLPYFVMELVNGLPLTRYCDEARLTPRARLELMVPICQAVQHAHQKGIIHRDLKPANILVTQIDGRPVPKVIDFGVAKATRDKLTEETVSTLFGGVVGTIDYMAPEQAGFSGVDVDTRADIYSLGVLL